MTNKGKDTFTWLHLSDFHFCDKADWQADVVLESLVRDVLRKLPEQGLVPDAVLITGDIAQSGKEAEYQTALTFFSEMADVLDHDPEKNWFLVPGNHDVNRTSIDDAYKAFRATINESNVNAFLKNDGFRKGLVARQEAFFHFTETFLGPHRKWSQDDPWKTEFLNVGGHSIAIVCLNSAWLSQDDEDNGKLLISEHQVRQLLKDANKNNPHLKIGLMHHPMDELQNFDHGKVKKILNSRRGCHFLLRGHLHETDLALQQNPTTGAVHMAAGACWQSADKHHSVSLVQLDFSKNKGTAHVWMYSPSEDGFWTPDTRLYQGMDKGTWCFDFPESWELNQGQERTIPPGPKEPLLPLKYKNHLLDQYGQLETLQASETPLVFRLQKVFVPLYTSWTEPEKQKRHLVDQKSKGNHGERALEMEQPKNRKLTDLLKMDKHRHFAVAGGPGYGKSTFVRFAALGELENEKGKLPLLLELKDFGDWLQRQGGGKDPQLLLTWAGMELQRFGLHQAGLVDRSGEGGLLWLLDGLDEIFDPAVRLRAAAVIGNWFSDRGKNDCLVVTGRPHAFDQIGILASLGLGDHRVEVLPLDEGGQTTFLKHWFGALYGENSVETARLHRERLQDGLKKHDHLTDLCGNPLLLSAIAAVYHQGKDLPERRADLYGQAISVLLNRRFGANHGGSDRVVRHMRMGLSLVARWMQEQGRARKIDQVDFLDRLVKGFIPERKAQPEERLEIEDLAERLGSHSGLLTLRGTPPVYQFSHLGFQEYLAGRAFGEEPDAFEALKPHLEKENWREVILLTAGYLLESGPSHLGTTFTKKLLAWSEQKDGSDDRLALVLDVAAEAPGGTLPEPLLKDLRSRAVSIIQDGSGKNKAGLRRTVGLALGRLGDPRLDPKSESRWVWIKPGSFQMGSETVDDDSKPVHEVQLSRGFWIGRYPVTNQEYARFLADDGYTTRKYWSEDAWEWLNLSESSYGNWFKSTQKKYDIEDDFKDYFQPGKAPLFWRQDKWNGNNQPVVGVNWHEAQAYCRWLEVQLKKMPPSWWNEQGELRLPTEAEWEYTARGTEGHAYPWGETKPNPERANFRESEFQCTTPVGLYGPSVASDGVCDLAGNVWEYCLDSWRTNGYRGREAGVTDPLEQNDDEQRHVLRGGSWSVPAGGLAAAFRSGSWSWSRVTGIGFRCVVSVAAEHD